MPSLSRRRCPAHTRRQPCRRRLRWHWARAEEQFQRAFGLNPRDPVAHHWYAINYLVPLGRFDVARRELALAAEANPLSMPIRLSAGLTSYFAHDFERARLELEESLELDPGASTAYLFLGLTLAELVSSTTGCARSKRRTGSPPVRR